MRSTRVVPTALALFVLAPLVLSPPEDAPPATGPTGAEAAQLTAAPQGQGAQGKGGARPPGQRGQGEAAKPPPAPNPEARAEAVAERGRRQGAGGAAAADSDASPRALPKKVVRTPPDLTVQPNRGLDRQEISAAARAPGVSHVASGARFPVEVRPPGEKAAKLTLLVVDPIAFRPLTPQSTAQSRAVWERLLQGEMMVRHDVAQRHGLELGGTVKLSGPGGQRDVRIGAFASNGVPPVAEAVVSWEVGKGVGAGRPNFLVVALGKDARLEDSRAAIREAIQSGEVNPVRPPPREQAVIRGAGSHQFEPFTYIDHGDGMITISSSWVARNIVAAEVPVFGVVRCHRVMIPQLRAALAEVQARGLAHRIDRSQYGGCWVPRHILFDPDRALSMHAWGLAIDFNVFTNQYGASPQMDPRIVEIFRRWGFRWGGVWSTPDGMHFEISTVVRSDEGD